MWKSISQKSDLNTKIPPTQNICHLKTESNCLYLPVLLHHSHRLKQITMQVHMCQSYYERMGCGKSRKVFTNIQSQLQQLYSASKRNFIFSAHQKQLHTAKCHVISHKLSYDVKINISKCLCNIQAEPNQYLINLFFNVEIK